MVVGWWASELRVQDCQLLLGGHLLRRSLLQKQAAKKVAEPFVQPAPMVWLEAALLPPDLRQRRDARLYVALPDTTSAELIWVRFHFPGDRVYRELARAARLVEW
jgi:hypothetical protein